MDMSCHFLDSVKAFDPVALHRTCSKVMLIPPPKTKLFLLIIMIMV